MIPLSQSSIQHADTCIGGAGLLAGAVGGILRSTSTPTLFAVASGIQWFALGATFSATRQFVIQAPSPIDDGPISPLLASAISGATAGGVGGALRSRKNIIPGMLVFGAAGAMGQKIWDSRQVSNQAAVVTEDGQKGAAGGEKQVQAPKASWMNAKWSPVKVLSDDEYENLLREKLLRVDADIAILDESIEAVKAEGAKQKMQEKGTMAAMEELNK